MDYLYILREALVWIITIFWLYQVLVSLCSLVKIKDKPLKVKKDHRFMAIIPAHNEEAVVKNLIESLKAQNYNDQALFPDLPQSYIPSPGHESRNNAGAYAA